MSAEAATFVAQVLLAGFLAVLFLQSGLDKVLDWKGNKAYIGGYLEKTPLRRVSTLALLAITAMEVTTGVLCAAGSATVLLTRDSTVAFLGATIAALTLLFLFLGQRLAKDYAAAAGLVPYFLAAIATVIAEGQRLG